MLKLRACREAAPPDRGLALWREFAFVSAALCSFVPSRSSGLHAVFVAAFGQNVSGQVALDPAAVLLAVNVFLFPVAVAIPGAAQALLFAQIEFADAFDGAVEDLVL